MSYKGFNNEVLIVEEDEIENQNEDGKELLGNVENVNGIDGVTTREALIVLCFIE